MYTSEDSLFSKRLSGHFWSSPFATKGGGGCQSPKYGTRAKAPMPKDSIKNGQTGTAHFPLPIHWITQV